MCGLRGLFLGGCVMGGAWGMCVGACASVLRRAGWRVRWALWELGE